MKPVAEAIERSRTVKIKWDAAEVERREPWEDDDMSQISDDTDVIAILKTQMLQLSLLSWTSVSNGNHIILRNKGEWQGLWLSRLDVKSILERHNEWFDRWKLGFFLHLKNFCFRKSVDTQLHHEVYADTLMHTTVFPCLETTRQPSITVLCDLK